MHGGIPFGSPLRLLLNKGYFWSRFAEKDPENIHFCYLVIESVVSITSPFKQTLEYVFKINLFLGITYMAMFWP